MDAGYVEREDGMELENGMDVSISSLCSIFTGECFCDIGMGFGNYVGM